MFVRSRCLLALLFALAVAIVGPAGTVSSASAELPEGSVVQQSSEDTPLEYHFPERYRPTAEIFERRDGPAVQSLSRSLGLESFPAVDVWIVPNANDYFAYNKLESRAPKWAIGLSLGDQQTVVVAHDTQMPGGTHTELDKTFVHELAHVTVDVASRGRHVPRWFHEGFALMEAGEWTPQRQEQLAKAASTGALMSFENLSRNFPAHHNIASTAYAQSFHFVKYLQDKHGPQVFAEIFEKLRDGTAFGDALAEVTGATVAAQESDWKASLTEGTSWVAVFRDESMIFFGLALILVLGWAVKRVRRNEDLDAMDDEPDGWDYDTSRYPLPGDDSD